MKSKIKIFVFFLCRLLILPLVIMYWLFGLLGDKDECFASFSQLISILPGKLGVYLRASFYKFTMNKCSSDAYICFSTIFSQIDTDIGKGAYLGPQCNIGRCKIGENCLLGSGVHIVSGNKQHYIDDIDILIKDQGGEFQKIHVGNNTWIGNNSVIIADVGENCVIGAGSVVTKPIGDNQIVAGNPAKLIKMRTNPVLVEEGKCV